LDAIHDYQGLTISQVGQSRKMGETEVVNETNVQRLIVCVITNKCIEKCLVQVIAENA